MRILDWYQLVEHVWAAARVLYPDNSAACRWSEAGAVAMAALVVHRLNQTWDDLWATKPLNRAA
jgi:hypothetical protein